MIESIDMAEPLVLRMAIASRREEAERVHEALGGLLRRMALDDDARDRIELAVREAVANAIVHGNRERTDGTVRIFAEVTDGVLSIRIDDEGDGFDFARVEDPRAPDRRRLPHGRGLWLMHTLVDELHMERCPEGGTSVILRARLSGPFRPVGMFGSSEITMNVDKRTKDNVTILSPKGKVTIGVGDVALRNAVQEALEAGEKNIVLDLSGVTTVDSSGLGELVSSYTRTTNQGGKLKLANLPPKISDLLMITRLITVFETYDTTDEAVASFA